jgi:hypothetical protein
MRDRQAVATSWKELLARVRPRDHLVQLYEDDDSLTSRVSHYLREGLEREEAVVAIATPPHREAFQRQLAHDHVDIDRAVDRGQLIVLDAEETLAQFMVDGRPDSDRFQANIGSVLDGAAERDARRGLRAYGEMVDLLWRDGNLSAAVHLEHLWHRLLRRRALPLLCAYRIDIFDGSFHEESFQAVLAIHSHLMPVGNGDQLEKAVRRGMEEMLGRDTVAGLAPLIAAAQYPRVVLCPAEAAVVWLARALPHRSEEILARARFHHAALCAGTEAQ